MSSQTEAELLRSIIETTTNIVLAMDRQMQLLYTNPQAQQLLGYDTGELRALHLFDLVPSDAKAAINKKVEDLLATRRSSMMDLHLRSQAGVGYAVNGIVSIWKQAGGEDGILFYGLERALIVDDDPSLAHLVNNLPGFAYRCLNDLNWTALLISQGIVKLTGYTPQDLVYNQKIAFGDIIHPDDRGRDWEDTQAALKERRPYESTYRITTASGDVRWILDRGQGIYGAEGQVIALEGFVVDVTAQRQIQHALHESEQRLTILVDNAPMLLFMVDRERRFNFARGAILKDWVLDPNAVIGKFVPKFYQDYPVILDALEAALQGQTKLFTVDIANFTYLAIASPFYDEQGQLAGVIGGAIDISPQQQAEKALRHAIRQLTMLYEGARALIDAATMKELLKAFAGHMVHQEGCHASLLYAHNDAKGQPISLELACLLTPATPAMYVPTGDVRFEVEDFPLWEDLVTPSYQIVEIADIDSDVHLLTESNRARLKAFGVAAFAAMPLKLHNQWLGLVALSWAVPRQLTIEERHYFETLAPQFAVALEIQLLFQHAERAIIEREQLIADLQAANQKANEASHLKTEFLATMSHELRTPLNSIIGFSGIMLQGIGGKFDDTARHMITAIFESGEHLLALINDILDISKIEAGRLEFVNERLDIRAMINGWQSHLKVLVGEKTLEFEVNVLDNVPHYLFGDRERITQIANNLLSNAFKFTAQGKVSLSVSWLDERLCITVADTGIGIPQEALEFIFDEFRQVDASTQREHGGTGLGLNIVRRLSRAMGGDVAVTSEIGKGSAFTVTLALPKV